MKHRVIDVKEPNLYKEIFPYDEIPKTIFNNIQLPMELPEDIWITDTTFRDGQQSMTSMTTEQMVRIFDMLHELDNGSGIIRQTEFFYTMRRTETLYANVWKGDTIFGGYFMDKST